LFGDSVPLPEIEATIERNPRASTRHETLLRRPDGTAVPVRLTFSALRSGEGDRLGLIGACDDLSAIRAMEARMRQADRLATLGRLAAGLKILRGFSGPLVWRVDPQRFRQVLWNLCLNAVEAMPEGGELRVGATLVPGHKLEVSVADSGHGIAPDDLAHVFEPFFSTKADGTGLGLSLVHRIVQEHGGEVDVRSTPGLGTMFTVTLPARHA